ncbi:MAG: colanic acid biosynthesis glycosyl transferase WcaI [Verrucomicrobiota bacterium]
MRVVVWGINYAPEITGIAPHNVAFCEFLQRRGDDIEMLTTFAYYPAWRKNPEDRNRLYRVDKINGVPVHRCWHYVPRRVSAWKRILHEGTFVLTSTIRALLLKRADIYFIPSPPLLLGAAGWFVAKIKRAPFVFHVQDLQPDAAVGLGMLAPGLLTRALYRLEAFAYKHAARVSGISEEILDAFRRKDVPEKKLLLFPNTVIVPNPEKIPAPGRFRAKHGFRSDEFLAIYAGNLGVKQGLDILLDTAELLSGEKNIRIVLCGDGAQREALEESVRDRRLENVSMIPLQHGVDYQELLVDADISLITQQTGSGNAFFPSKLLVTLAHSSPVVTVADEGSALAQAVSRGQFGINVIPKRADYLADAFSDLSQNRARLDEWGRAGRTYVSQFDQPLVMERFVQELCAIDRSAKSE